MLVAPAKVAEVSFSQKHRRKRPNVSIAEAPETKRTKVENEKPLSMFLTSYVTPGYWLTDWLKRLMRRRRAAIETMLT